jgi:hypothetical protein
VQQNSVRADTLTQANAKLVDTQSAIALAPIVLWNTMYMEAALNQLRAEGMEVKPEDVVRLSPLSQQQLGGVVVRQASAFPRPRLLPAPRVC